MPNWSFSFNGVDCRFLVSETFRESFLCLVFILGITHSAMNEVNVIRGSTSDVTLGYVRGLSGLAGEKPNTRNGPCRLCT